MKGRGNLEKNNLAGPLCRFWREGLVVLMKIRSCSMSYLCSLVIVDFFDRLVVERASLSPDTRKSLAPFKETKRVFHPSIVERAFKRYCFNDGWWIDPGGKFISNSSMFLSTVNFSLAGITVSCGPFAKLCRARIGEMKSWF